MEQRNSHYFFINNRYTLILIFGATILDLEQQLLLQLLRRYFFIRCCSNLIKIKVLIEKNKKIKFKKLKKITPTPIFQFGATETSKPLLL